MENNSVYKKQREILSLFAFLPKNKYNRFIQQKNCGFKPIG